MSNENTLTLCQADEARAEFALIESNLEFIASQLAQRPTRGDLAKAALGIGAGLQWADGNHGGLGGGEFAGNDGLQAHDRRRRPSIIA